MDSNYFILLIYLRTLLYFHLNQFALLTKASLVPIIPTFLPSSNSADLFPSIIMTKVVILFPQVQTALMRSIRGWGGGGEGGITFPSPFREPGGAGRGSESKFQTQQLREGARKGVRREGGRQVREQTEEGREEREQEIWATNNWKQGRSPRPVTHSPRISAGGRQCAGRPHCSPGRLEGQLEATQWGMPSAKDR